MTEFPDKTFERRREWTLSKETLQRLLNWLDGSASSDGHAYVEMRRRLRDYFARKNCLPAEDLADETLTRVARRLEEEGITCVQELDPLNRHIITRYYIGTARVKIDNRRTLAESLGLSLNALTVRACRIRMRLEACVRRCAGAG